MQKVQRALLWFTGFIAIVWLMREMHPINGMIGHDYALLFLRMLINSAHIWQNGLQVQHYSAAACGGIAIFADPQSMGFSLIQLLALHFDPWVATQLSLCLLYPAGYWFFYRLARRRFNLEEVPSHGAALLFILSGFTFVNMYVGHATHHSYLLLPLMLDLMLRPCRQRREQLYNAALLALVLLYLIYSGSLHMLAVFGAATGLLIPYWIARRATENQLKTAGVAMVGALAFFALGAAAKLYAVHSYSPNFLIRGMDLSAENPLLILWRYFYFMPGRTPPLVPWGEYLFGAWEYVSWVSKTTIPLMLIFFWAYLRRSTGKQKLVFFLSAAVAVELAMLGVGQGGNEFLPFFNSYHNPIKLLAAFIPFICLLSAMGLQQLGHYLARARATYALVAWVIFVAILGFEAYTYTSYFTRKGIGIGYAFNPELYYQAQSHGRLPQIRNVINSVGDWEALAAASTNIGCYEPLFGYKGEKKGNVLIPGPVTDIRDGRFNLTHPGCLVYPEYFNCRPWDRISAGDAENLQKFTLGKTPQWGVPPVQQILLWVALFVVLGLTGVIGAGIIRGLKRR